MSGRVLDLGASTWTAEHRRRYEPVGEAWKAAEPAWPMLDQEAIDAARLLYRYATGKRWRAAVVVTSGNRISYVRAGKLWVNPSRGWQHLVHEISHETWARLHPEAPPHDPGHAAHELRLTQYVIERGWHRGALRPPPEPEPTEEDRIAVRRAALQVKLDRITARQRAWTSKARRAATALRKLTGERRRAERALEKLGVTP